MPQPLTIRDTHMCHLILQTLTSSFKLTRGSVVLHLIYFVDNEPNELLTLLMDKKFSGTRQGHTRLSSSARNSVFLLTIIHILALLPNIERMVFHWQQILRPKVTFPYWRSLRFAASSQFSYCSYVFVLLKIVYVSFDCLYLVLKVTLNCKSKF